MSSQVKWIPQDQINISQIARSEYFLQNNTDDQGVLISGSSAPKVYANRYNTRSNSLENSRVLVRQNDLNAQITTLTDIIDRVLSKKFYSVENLPSYVPIESKQSNGWSEELLQIFDASEPGNLEDGFVDALSPNTKLTSNSASYTTKTYYLNKWAKGLDYTLFSMNMIQSASSSMINEVERAESLRKKQADLAYEKILFLGRSGNLDKAPGLLTNESVTSNTSSITASLGSMTDADFLTAINNINTAWNTQTKNIPAKNLTLLVPSVHYTQLKNKGVTVSTNYVRNRLEHLEDALGIKGCKVLPLAFCDDTFDTSGTLAGLSAMSSKQFRYVLYDNDSETVASYITIPYTQTAFGTNNNFAYQSVAYQQCTTANVFNFSNILYFDF